MSEREPKAIHTCQCAECSEHPRSEAATLHRSINDVISLFDEKSRRRFAGLLAMQNGYGGVRYVSRVTGLSRTTILRGQREIQQADVELSQRIRAPGGGAKLIEKKTRC